MEPRQFASRGGSPKRLVQGRRILRLLDRAESIRPFVTEGGRSYVQGAIGWIWARHQRTIPIPGFRTVDQVEELVGVMGFGTLPQEAFEQAKETMQ